MAENKVGEAKKMAAEAKGTIREFWRKSIEPNLMKWFLILLGILILMLAFLYSLWVWLTSKVVEVSKKVPEVAEQVGEGIVTISPPPAPSNIWLYVIGTIFFIFLVYLANKWKDEPDLIKMKPKEKKAEVKKLIAFLIMLILGSVLLGVAAQLYAVNFQGINLTKSLFFLFVAIGVANLILQPGTGTALVKTFIFCSCLVIGLSVYGIYKGWQPIPKEKRVVAGIKEQSCQAELAVPMQKIKEIRASLEQVITKEKRRELIEALEKEEEKCEGIRQFYSIPKKEIPLTFNLKKSYKMDFAYPEQKKIVEQIFGDKYGQGHKAKRLLQEENHIVYQVKMPTVICQLRGQPGRWTGMSSAMVLDGNWDWSNRIFKGSWKRSTWIDEVEEVLSTGGFKMKFDSDIAKGEYWFKLPEDMRGKKYALKFY